METSCLNLYTQSSFICMVIFLYHGAIEGNLQVYVNEHMLLCVSVLHKERKNVCKFRRDSADLVSLNPEGTCVRKISVYV